MLIDSPEAMFAYGKSISTVHKVLLLSGDLGAGKTTLVKGFAEGIGIDPEVIQSPTYAYLHNYAGKLLHIDMYRFESMSEVLEKGVLDQISEFEYLVIEWPKWIDQLGLEDYLALHIEKISASQRKIVKL